MKSESVELESYFAIANMPLQSTPWIETRVPIGLLIAEKKAPEKLVLIICTEVQEGDDGEMNTGLRAAQTLFLLC